MREIGGYGWLWLSYGGLWVGYGLVMDGYGWVMGWLWLSYGLVMAPGASKSGLSLKRLKG